MRRLSLALSILLLCAASVLRAEVVIRPVAESGGLTAGKSIAVEPWWLSKVDYAAGILLLPFFEVDKNTPGGEVTLYTVRNVTDQAVDLQIDYADVFGQQQIPTTEVNLGAKETFAVNVNDVAGLGVDLDGFARGWALIIGVPQLVIVDDESAGEKGEFAPSTLVGDFFQAVPNQDFATGDRLLTFELGNPYADLCQFAEVRFLDGGAFSGGTQLMFFVASPGGSDVGNDPPSFTVTAYDEAGNALSPANVFTEQNVVELDASIFAGGQAAGTLEVEFNGFGGAIFASFSAENRFSVGLRAACKLLQVAPI